MFSGWPLTPVRGQKEHVRETTTSSREIVHTQKQVHIESVHRKEVNSACNEIESQEVTEVVSTLQGVNIAGDGSKRL